MNWGKYIIITYGIFVICIVYLVVRSMNQKQDLVTGDYYAKELVYQKTIDESNAAAKIEHAVTVKQTNDSICILFSDYFKSKPIEGSALVYCPSDEKKDIKKEFHFSPRAIELKFPYKSTGYRKVKINWKSDTVSYYSEQDIFLK